MKARGGEAALHLFAQGFELHYRGLLRTRVEHLFSAYRHPQGPAIHRVEKELTRKNRGLRVVRRYFLSTIADSYRTALWAALSTRTED